MIQPELGTQWCFLRDEGLHGVQSCGASPSCWLLPGLMCGSELNVAVFAHPTLNRRALEAHIPVRAAFAKLCGRVMPFWMAGSTLLNLLVLLLFEHLQGSALRLAAIAFCIQVFAALIFPVPINNRSGHRFRYLAIGTRRNVVGMHTIGLERWD